MARSKITSPAEDLIELAALLPWWLSVALALVSYYGLHHLAMLPMPVSLRPHQVPTLMFSSVLRAFALFGQYLLPFAFGVGAVVSLVARHRRHRLVASVFGSKGDDVVDCVSWQQFEQLVGGCSRQ